MQSHTSHPATALVLGATGCIGGEMICQLRDAGWRVRALYRQAVPSKLDRDGISWLRGDAMSAADVAHAAEGCQVIVHAVNPPGYRRWAELAPPMLDNTLAAAIRERATVVLPGSVYNYGPDAYGPADAFPLLHEDAPQRPLTAKGAVRVDLERRLEAATTQGARALIVRAGDFFGPRRGNHWFAQGLVAPGKPLRTIRLPGSPGIGHQWAYLPDVGRTILALLQRREQLPAFARFHMAGHWDDAGSQLAAFLGSEPHTPLDEALEASLRGLGCLPPAQD
ncbi:MAG: NAD-dependent epimerase/dehydratase family protein [Pigmentiphaga sp.]